VSGYISLLAASALRRLGAQPPRIAGPLLTFICGSLARDPHRRSGALRGELAGYRSARRGDFRVLVVLDDDARTMTVLDIGHPTTLFRTS
jgi:mRNA-degrading endonuclease RelE of RelBE toxin-antitoxin system